MTVAAVPAEGDSVPLGREELNDNAIASITTVDHDIDAVAPVQRSRPTLSAILRTTKQV